MDILNHKVVYVYLPNIAFIIGIRKLRAVSFSDTILKVIMNVTLDRSMDPSRDDPVFKTEIEKEQFWEKIAK